MQINRCIRLYAIDDFNQNLLHSAVLHFNRAQDFFSFDICRENLLKGEYSRDEIYDDQELETSFLHEAQKRYPGEFPVFLTSLGMKEGITSSSDSRSAILSMKNWDFTQGYNFSQILAYFMADILITRKVDFPPHEGSLKLCPADSCDEFSQRVEGMRRAQYCKICNTEIRKALNSGILGFKETAAVYKLLDSINDNKRVFIAMPFSNEFNMFYRSHLKKIVVKSGWVPIRIDEVNETAEITDLIKEELFRSRAAIIDLTGKNPNVYYEFGFANAIEIPVIPIIQDYSETCFDTRQFKTLKYSFDDTVKMDKSIVDYLKSIG